MEAIAQVHHLSVADYLKLEAGGQVRHEYIGGSLHAMAGTSLRNNVIAGNLFNRLSNHLRGGPCQTYMADVKVRLEVNREDIFYYPDVMVACVRDGVEEYFLRYPKVIFEVLSPSTEAIDRREKLLNYQQIPTVVEYVIVAQDTREVTVYRREDGWKPTVLSTPDAVVEIRSLKLTLPLTHVYDRVE